jgi:hypothetical protein
MDVQLLYRALFVCWKISTAYEAIDVHQQGNSSGVLVGELAGNTWKKQQIS